MSRYIDAERLKDDMAVLLERNEKLIDEWLANCVDDLIDDQPTADVEEVKHGEWVFKFYCGNMSGYDYGMTCSVCGKPPYRQLAEKMPPFCPNCGASMVNEDE